MSTAPTYGVADPMESASLRPTAIGSQVSRLLTGINKLSLDAPLVAMTWQWAFSDAAGVRLGWEYYLILGGSVWCVYVLDRVIDGLFMSPDGPATPRHEFAQRHPGALFLLCVATTFLMVVLSLFLLPLRVLSNWIALALGVTGYFIVVHGLRPARMVIAKEILVAFLFAGGSAIFVLSTQPLHGMAVLPPFFGAFLLFFGNASSISIWERAFDRSSRQSSIAVDFPRLIHLLPWYLAVLGGLAFLAPILGVGSWRIGASVGTGSMLLWTLDRLGSRLGLAEKRELADLALLSPLLIRLLG